MKTIHPNASPNRPLSHDRKALGVLTATALFGALVGMAAFSPSASNRAVAAPPADAPAVLRPCIGCHAPNLAGRPGFSPSLLSTGVLKHYNKKTFERVMNTGVTDDGTPVKKPMPVFHWKASMSDAAYAYLKKQK